jgi:uncharacterized membrane protein
MRCDYVKIYVIICVLGNHFFSFKKTLMIHHFTFCMVVRTMTMIMMILTTYITEQGVGVSEISYFWPNKAWNICQDTNICSVFLVVERVLNLTAHVDARGGSEGETDEWRG